MHLKRLLIAAVLIPLLYFYVTKLSALYFFFLVASAASLAQYEFYKMYNVKGVLKYLGIVLGLLTLYVVYASNNTLAFKATSVTDVIIISFILIACVRLFYKRNPSSSMHDISAVVIGVAYIAGLISYHLYLRDRGAEWIVILYILVWASDSGAFYAGRTFGKHKLYEEISPNKTIEGLIGSIGGGIIGALVFKFVFASAIVLTLSEAVVIGAVAGVVSVIGDLVESMFKRDAGIKDSGNLFSAHGGMLDKIDSALFVGPVLYWISFAMGLLK